MIVLHRLVFGLDVLCSGECHWDMESQNFVHVTGTTTTT